MISLYICLYTYLYVIDSMIANYFALLVFAVAYTDSIFIKKRGAHLNYSILFYLLFLFLAMLSFFWTVSEEMYLDALPRTLFFMIMTVSVYNTFFWYDIRKFFLWGIFAGGVLNLFIYFNLFPFPEQIFDGPTRFSGTLGNSNDMGVFISFSIFATTLLINFFEKNKFFKIILITYIPISLYLLFQTGSRTSILLGFSFLILLFINYVKTTKGFLYISGFAFLFLLGFNYLMKSDEFSEQFSFVSERFESAQETIEGTGSESSTELRVYFIREGLNKWMNRPVFGHGNRSFSYYFGTYAHNNYVEILVNLGVLGFVLFYLFFLFTMFSVFKLGDRDLKIHGLFFIFSSLLFVEFGRVYNMNAIYIIMIIMISSFRSNFIKESISETLDGDKK